ncbi:hypothetical protein EGR_08793 [Echinococcus granulosus]|uniref:Uncharacterized protein n=1 Tax=Echinococcus granulosus TaxID=6210 RepID=W6UDH1_ECHGR|nr:hypothetical protein EGR_08793 [Echinococcus granulosus]EUB56367.1 hypothetical protein EGR_08793 [Echinococcus granulosus]
MCTHFGLPTLLSEISVFADLVIQSPFLLRQVKLSHLFENFGQSKVSELQKAAHVKKSVPYTTPSFSRYTMPITTYTSRQTNKTRASIVADRLTACNSKVSLVLLPETILSFGFNSDYHKIHNSNSTSVSELAKRRLVSMAPHRTIILPSIYEFSNLKKSKQKQSQNAGGQKKQTVVLFKFHNLITSPIAKLFSTNLNVRLSPKAQNHATVVEIRCSSVVYSGTSWTMNLAANTDECVKNITYLQKTLGQLFHLWPVQLCANKCHLLNNKFRLLDSGLHSDQSTHFSEYLAYHLCCTCALMRGVTTLCLLKKSQAKLKHNGKSTGQVSSWQKNTADASSLKY